MKKIFTKLFLLTTILMVSSELWAQYGDCWWVLNEPSEKEVRMNRTETFTYNLAGPAVWFSFNIDCFSESNFVVYGYTVSGSRESIASGQARKKEEFRYVIEGKGYSRITITVEAGGSSATLSQVKAYSKNYPYTSNFGSAEYNSADASTSFTIDYYGTPNFTYSYESGDADKFPVSITTSGGKATITVKYLHNEVGSHSADIRISNGVFKSPHAFNGTTNKANQTITWNMGNKALNVGDQLTLDATASSGLDVTYTSSNTSAVTVLGNTLTAVGEGTATITASQTGNGNYNAATDITYTVSVSKATPTVTAWPTLNAVTYGATLEQALVLNGGSASVAGGFAIVDSYNTADVPNAGTYTYNVTFTPTDGNKYNAVTGGTASLVVNKAAQELTWSFADCTLLPGQALALDATSTCGAVSYEVTGFAIRVSGNTLTAEVAGTATIKAVDAGNSNYNAVESSVYTVTVSESGYTRAVTNGNYGTICLPYGSSSYAGAEFYEIAYPEIKNGDVTGLYLDQLEEGAALEAGKPYIFKATADELTVSYEGAKADAPVAGEAGLTGTLVDIAAGGVLVGNYIIAQNMFWDASAENWLNANRAYINKATLLSVPPKSPVPGRRRVSMGETSENGATGVENTMIAPNSLKVIENGQLIIIREGVKYNAQGVHLGELK